jgi:hypothetical protein
MEIIICGFARMKRIIFALLAYLTATGHAGVIDDLKAMAAKFGMQYYGTSDKLGKAYYVFMDSQHELLVSIPADIQTNDQAAICFQSGWASASATHGLADSAKQPFQKQKPRKEGEPWLDDPMTTPLVAGVPSGFRRVMDCRERLCPARMDQRAGSTSGTRGTASHLFNSRWDLIRLDM